MFVGCRTNCNHLYIFIYLSFVMLPTPRLDRLSALLEGLAPRISVHHAGHVTDEIMLPAAEGDRLHLHLLTHGSVDLVLDGGRSVALRAPAIAILRTDCAHRLKASNPDDAPDLYCATAHFEGPAAALLLEGFDQPLPFVLENPGTELDLIVRLITHELSNPRCGHPALLARAGEILFIGLLRHLVASPRTPAGLLNGLADARIARALVAVHRAPQAPWTIDALALEAGMSRTAFTERFRQTMNNTPGAYIAKLRLSVARRVVHAGQGLKRAAALAGFSSSSALSRALNRKRDD